MTMDSLQMDRFRQVMGTEQPLIGMVHLLAMPGTPDHGGRIQAIVDHALKDAETLKRAGFDVLLLENMHDLPYLRREVGHEVSSLMALIGYRIKQEMGLPTGLQILAGANQAALAAAHTAGLDFIRAEGFVFGHVADEGWMDADAGPLLRYKKMIGAEKVLILNDIKKKHAAHTVTADVSLLETAKAAEFFKSDGVIVTGTATGHAASQADLQLIHRKTNLPVLVGSGTTVDNIKSFQPLCDGFIIGSSIKTNGDWRNPVDLEAAQRLVDAFRR